MLNRNRSISIGAMLVLFLLLAGWWWARDRSGELTAGATAAPKETPASKTVAAPGTAPGADAQWESRFVSGPGARPLAAAQLTDFAPAELAGLQRTIVTSETSAGADTSILTVHAHYASPDGKALELRIADLGGPRGVGAQAAWALVGDQDNTGEEGYERTRTANGRHYYELWESAQGRGEQAVLLGERITVSVSGHPANASTLGTALNEVDLAGLERLVRP